MNEITPTKKKITVQRRLPTKRQLTLYGAGGAVLAIGGALALVTVLKIAVTLITYALIFLLAIAVFYFLPTIIRTIKIARLRAIEEVARQMPLETLYQERERLETMIANKSRQLAISNGALADYERLLRENKDTLDPMEYEFSNAELQAAYKGFAEAKTHLQALHENLDEFDLVIKQQEIRLRIAEAKSSVAASLSQSQGNTEDRLAVQSAISSITRKVAENNELLDQALRRAATKN